MEERLQDILLNAYAFESTPQMFVLVSPILTTERAPSEAQEWGEENFDDDKQLFIALLVRRSHNIIVPGQR